MSNRTNTAKLGQVAEVYLSNVDKVTKPDEKLVKLCNYTDVYKNASIRREMANDFMIASANKNEIAKFKLKKGQVAITKDSETRDDIGVPAYIADDFEDVLLGYHLALISPVANKLDGEFLNYFLRTHHIRKYFENYTSGSGQRCTLALDSIKDIPLELPDISSQRQIAAVLSALDAKIELNNRINRELEALAKTIYDYWFAQFDFPDAHGKPYRSSGGKMTYNETLKRQIPENWEAGTLGDIANNILRGLNQNDIESETPYIGLEHMPRKSMSLNDWGDSSEVESNKSGFRAGEFLFGKLRPYFHKVGIAPVDGVCSTDILVIAAKRPEFYGFVFNVIFSEDFVNYAAATSGGTKMPRTSWKALAQYPIAIPNITTSASFSGQFSVLAGKIKNNILQNRELARLRDWLLPMLMNGQVTVR